MSSRPPLLGAYVRGFSAMAVLQAARERVPQMIRQLESDPSLDPRYARELRNTWAEIEAASEAYLDWRERLPQVASAEVPQNLPVRDSSRPASWDRVGSVAERLRCSTRWVRQLINTGASRPSNRRGVGGWTRLQLRSTWMLREVWRRD